MLFQCKVQALGALAQVSPQWLRQRWKQVHRRYAGQQDVPATEFICRNIDKLFRVGFYFERCTFIFPETVT